MDDEITPLIVKTAERVGLSPEKVREVFTVFEEEFDREEEELRNRA